MMANRQESSDSGTGNPFEGTPCVAILEQMMGQQGKGCCCAEIISQMAAKCCDGNGGGTVDSQDAEGGAKCQPNEC